ncbi:hypothetical protein [Bosea sp. (in: a-proteobacteria)]|uniref:hypothetical protein n=1 Tax=Bosea sp. (in: a-proteobacteria) TaxID=1871050 RepID=UPI002FC77B14
MTYVLNNAAEMPAIARAEATGTTAGPGFWQRFYAALIESRRRSALRELRAYSYLARESEITLGGFPTVALKSDAELPFNR